LTDTSATNAQLPLVATMTGMSPVDRDIFSLLSEGTAKQRLLAEQVKHHKYNRYSTVTWLLTLTPAARINHWCFRANMSFHNACRMYDGSRTAKALREGPFHSHYSPSHGPDIGYVLLSEHMLLRATCTYQLPLLPS
jgi:hypothetical protein